MEIRPILSVLLRHKTAAALIVLEIALSCAIICNAIFVIGHRTGEMRRDSGVAEVWYGELAEGKPQIDLATDAVAALPSAGAYSGGKRLYGYVKGDLMWVGERSTPEVPLRPYMSAHLKKVVDPREWVKDIKDLPDDGIAFFK